MQNIILSTRTKEAIKTALAMTISYGIALYMDWEKPMWAGFAVAFISLDTIGQSLNKGAMRMLGTLVATIVALIILSLFTQDRWLFMLVLTLHVGFCTYRMGGGKHSYFWFASGFVSIIIALEAGPDSENTFLTALLRAETTGLGVLVYSLVSVLIWPSSTRSDFFTSVDILFDTQHNLYLSCNRLMEGSGNSEQVQNLIAQEIKLHNRFEQMLDAAVTDSYEVWELRRQWTTYRAQSTELTETIKRWRESFIEDNNLDLHALMPGLHALQTEIDLRMKQMHRMLKGEAPEQKPQKIDLGFNRGAVHSLPHFQKAAFAVIRSDLLKIERLTRALFDTISDIKGFGEEVAIASKPSDSGFIFFPDPDRLIAGIRVMAGIWLAFLLMVYVNEIPGGVSFIITVGVYGMLLSTKPQASALQLLVPVVYSTLFAGFLYIFIMPHLSGFTELGGLIFIITFLICYLFSSPKQALGRAFGLALFVIIISVTNEQSYSFLSFANKGMMFPLSFAVLIITAYFPISMRPEKAFSRQLERFFNSCEYLTSTLRWDPVRKATWFDRKKSEFHYRELSTLPTKLMSWAPFIDTNNLPGTTPQDVENLTVSLQSLNLRMQELLEARGNNQSPFLVRSMLEDVRNWRVIVQKAFKRLASDPSIANREAFRSRLDGIMDQLEAKIEMTMNEAPEGELQDQDRENFYRLLGAYRGVSEALVNYAGSAGAVNWGRWREERFA